MNDRDHQKNSVPAGRARSRRTRLRSAPEPDDGAYCDVSVVVVSWNTRGLLRNCLGSILSCAGGVPFEIIVIDNASSDGSADMVAADFPTAKIIRNVRNRGFAAANNQGLRVARGRYVLLLNPDTLILNGAIAETVRFADAHPDAAVVGCHTLCGDGRLQYNCFLFPSLVNLFLSLTRLNRLYPRNRFFGRERMTWWDYDTPRIVDVVAGCFMLVRRRAIDDVGLMDESYFMYSEETDWCWRFRRNGWKTMYTPDATIVHFREGSTSQCAAYMQILHRRSLLLFLERKSGTATRWVANALFTVAAIVRLPALGLAWLRGGDSRKTAAHRGRLYIAALKFHVAGSVPSSS